MKLIVAVVRPFMLDRIIAALEEIEDFPGITVSDAEGFGRRPRDVYPQELNPFKPKKLLKIAANDAMVDEIVEVLRENAHTGKKGDGIVVVLPIEGALHI